MRWGGGLVGWWGERSVGREMGDWEAKTDAGVEGGFRGWWHCWWMVVGWCAVVCCGVVVCGFFCVGVGVGVGR